MEQQYKLSAFIAFSTVLFGQIYLRPFYSDFRFSMGVVIFGVFILLYDLKWHTYVFTIGSILAFRVGLAMISGISFDTAFETHFPSALYYGSFAIICNFANVKKYLNPPLGAMIILFLADSLSNWLELIFRGDLSYLAFSIKAQPLFLTAIFRTTLIATGFFLFKFYPELFQKEAEKRKMATWILNQSKLYNEVIFINKSEEDIEKAMKKAHNLYTSTRNGEKSLPKEMEISSQVLSISRDIHEIKKDYRRIRQALLSFIPKDLPHSKPSAKELIYFLCDDLEAYALSLNKYISIERNIDDDLPEALLFDYLSLINNLIVNAIDAIPYLGCIRLSLIPEEGLWQLTVSDDGEGISPDDLNYIFDPGYSTKFDPATGEMSTGLGLSQVYYIVSNVLNGSVKVTSSIGQGTTFHICFSADASTPLTTPSLYKEDSL